MCAQIGLVGVMPTHRMRMRSAVVRPMWPTQPVTFALRWSNQSNPVTNDVPKQLRRMILCGIDSGIQSAMHTAVKQLKVRARVTVKVTATLNQLMISVGSGCFSDF